MKIAQSIQNHVGHSGPIGVFDSGYGGLTILRELRAALPDVDYLYLGDNARAPYGTRSFDLVYRFTLQAVRYLFERGCPLVILACNTASAKALRTIQQHALPEIDPTRRVLGVIRPTAEIVGSVSHNGHIGLVATPGTVASDSYRIELAKLHPHLKLSSKACPMWVPLVENLEAESDGTDFFVRRDLDLLFEADPEIDTLILGCTHYPILFDKIKKYTPEEVTILNQGKIVADSLIDYLARHPEMDSRISRNGSVEYTSTEDPDKFSSMASLFMGQTASATKITL